ncbi:MAG: peptidoglycan DD-metalloendopeptidase family protein [Fibrobacteraceae bacterium]|nr:peptidoglycan DD-metalloendopeptidase family protein [Fibrobacteraceae bacterium]
MVNLNHINATKQKKECFDFSNLLIPITHPTAIGSPYGIRDHRLHRGVDVQAENREPVVAAWPGIVTVSKYNKGGYGHYVLVQHNNGFETLYGHLAERTAKVGDQVFPGDIVGLAGNTGHSSSTHLHFEIRYGDININPASVVNFPKWELQPGSQCVSRKKITTAHYNMQKKLKKVNYYVVKKGDTIKSVAAWFSISQEALIRINGLKKGAPLKVGQKLKGSK